MIRLKIILVLLFLSSFISVTSQPLKPTEVTNLSINSEYAEFGVKFYKNANVLFASSKNNKTSDKRDRRNNRQMGLRLYSGAIAEDGSVFNVSLFSPEENNPILEANVAFTSDFKTVYFTRNNYIQDDYRKQLKNNDSDDHILRIFKATISPSGKLSNITPTPINGNEYSVTNPVLNNSNSILYFSSDMPGSIGGFDLYAVDIHKDGSFGEPINLGANVNSKKDEFFPYIGEDGTLYFSSNGHKGKGNLDIYSISLNSLETATPQNLGEPINSKADDFALIYSNFRNIGYLSSSRKGTIGDVDIFSFKNNTESIPQFEIEVVDAVTFDASNEITTIDSDENNTSLSTNGSATENANITLELDTISNVVKKDTIQSKIILDSIVPPVLSTITLTEDEACVQTVEGVILSETNSIMSEATVTLYENGQNIGTYDLNQDGSYSFELKCNHHYRVTARLNKFEESYFEIRTTRFTGGKTTQNIVLERIPCDIFLIGELKDINTNFGIKGVKVYLIENNEQIDATETDLNGNYSFTAPCDGDYKIATDKAGYEEGVFNVSKTSNNNDIFLGNVLTPVTCEQIVRGRINNDLDQSPIINARVELFNAENELVSFANSNTNGNFHFNIGCDSDYKLVVTHEDFEVSQTEFKSTSVQKENHRIDFNLKSTLCVQTIAGTVINSRTKLAMQNVKVDLSKDGTLISSITTGVDGAFNFDVDCNANYNISATTPDYSIDSKVISTDSRNNAQTLVSIILETQLDFELVRNQLMIITDEIDFDLNQSDIREDAAIELNKIVTIMTRNPEIKVDIGVHTDSRAPDAYNLTLSEQRAQSILAFLINRGIDSDRLTGKGYGETQLLNECANGVNCSETQHLVNRRIEFIVTR